MDNGAEQRSGSVQGTGKKIPPGIDHGKGWLEQGGGRVGRPGSQRDSIYMLVSGANTGDLSREGTN